MYREIDAYIDRLLRESTPDRPLWNIESLRQGKPATWNYIDGCMLTALLALAEQSGEARYFDFVKRFVDGFVGEDGSIRTYAPEKFNLDDINEGRVLFPLYEKTGEEKYLLAAERLKRQLDAQPRTAEGNFWHKAIYPNQVWLDGIYMAQVFSALYAVKFGGGDCSDTVKQLQNVRARMFDEKKRLYYHGYDASRTAFWCDKTTGRSANFWLRSIGWFAVALADLIEVVPDPAQNRVFRELLAEQMEGLSAYADPETGLYWQVVDQGGREGNYLETSGSSMAAYAMLKGARLGVLGEEYAAKGEKTFHGIQNKYLSFSDGELNLGGICLVAGLGPENNPRRDGSYEYYISEPVVNNDAKGVAPFLLSYTEIRRRVPPA